MFLPVCVEQKQVSETQVRYEADPGPHVEMDQI